MALAIDPKFWPSWGLPPDTTEETAERVFRVLDEQLKRRFGLVLQPTPGRTGLLAWRRLQETRKGAVGGVWPTLPLDLQATIRETSGQGRFECCPAPGLMLPNLYCLDMQFAYAAGAAWLQSGKEWCHERGQWHPTPGAQVSLAPGWYHVRFAVPKGWSHVGILPFREDGGWTWPISGGISLDLETRQREEDTRETWASHHEVALAVECGWRVEILERIVALVPEGVNSYPCPLRLWAGKLIEMRETRMWEAQDDELWRGAIRNILLHAIGSFARGPKKVTRQAGPMEAVPDHELARSTLRPIPGGWEYEDYAPGGGDQAYQHPEWAALIWGWTRARLLRGWHYVNKERVSVGALGLPREWVVGFALDCIYTTCDPGWPPSDRPADRGPDLGSTVAGDFRVKRHVAGPLPAPRTMLDLYKLTGEAGE